MGLSEAGLGNRNSLLVTLGQDGSLPMETAELVNTYRQHVTALQEARQHVTALQEARQHVTTL